MKVFFVRHVKAGDRTAWEGDDRLRPVTKRGYRQAERLAEWLVGESFEAVVSSAYVRCLQTVVPLASIRGTSIEVAPGLAEGASLDESLSIVRKYADTGAVLCTHGDVIPMVLGHLSARGVDVGSSPQWPKGSTWVLDFRAGEVVAAIYRPPPDEA